VTRKFVCFDCGYDTPCILLVPDTCDMLPLCCPFYEPEDGVVRPPWHEARPVTVQTCEPSEIIVGS